MSVMSAQRNASPSQTGRKGEFESDWQMVSQAREWSMCKKQETKHGEQARGKLWLIDCTYWAIRMRLIGWLSLHWTVISQGAPLWKPFKCQLIDIIALKTTELLWYYRTQYDSPLWVNNGVNGNWQKMLQFRKGRQEQAEETKDSRKGERRNKRVQVTGRNDAELTCVCLHVHVQTAAIWGHGNLSACVFWPVD